MTAGEKDCVRGKRKFKVLQVKTSLTDLCHSTFAYVSSTARPPVFLSTREISATALMGVSIWD